MRHGSCFATVRIEQASNEGHILYLKEVSRSDVSLQDTLVLCFGAFGL